MAVADQEASTRKRKRKLMTKQERQELGDNLLAFDTTELLSHLAERMCREPHMDLYPERREFWKSWVGSFPNGDVQLPVKTLVGKMAQAFVRLYLDNETGKENICLFSWSGIALCAVSL